MDDHQHRMLLDIHTGMGEMRSGILAVKETTESLRSEIHANNGIKARVDRCEQDISKARTAIGWVWTGMLSLSGSAVAWWKSQQ